MKVRAGEVNWRDVAFLHPAPYHGKGGLDVGPCL